MNSDLNIDPQLFEILCCPKCKANSSLEFIKDSQKLKCDKCAREFNLKKVAGPEGKGMLIPDLLITDED